MGGGVRPPLLNYWGGGGGGGGRPPPPPGSYSTALSALAVFPIYMCYVYSLLHKKVQMLFTQLFLGALLCLLGVTSLLITDLVGHLLKHTTISNHSQCMFQFYTLNDTLQYPALDMHWSVLIPPSFFLGVGLLIVTTATLEVI